MTFRSLALAVAMVLAAAACAAQAPGTPRVTYSRSFEASVPAFLQVEIYQDGHAVYQVREKKDDPVTTLTFTASPDTVRTVFAGAKALNEFANPSLQAKQKVAFTGDKMLAYDDAAQHHAQQFTYTTRKQAKDLVDLFEAISVTGVDTVRLRRALQYQPLDVLGIMDQIRLDWYNHQIAEPQILEPTLREVAGNANIMNAAQQRARQLLEQMARADASAAAHSR